MNIKRLRFFMKTAKLTLLKLKGFEDYFNFPIPVTTPMPLSAPIYLLKLVKVFEQKKINYYVADGTLLGIYRDKTLIKHDNDIDFYLIDESEMWRIMEIMLGLEFKIGRMMSYQKKLTQLTFYNSEKIIIDFCLWQKKNNDESQMIFIAPEIFPRKLTLPSELFMEQNQTIWFQGINIKSFSNIEKFLRVSYGHKWNVPEKEKGNWQADHKNYN